MDKRAGEGREEEGGREGEGRGEKNSLSSAQDCFQESPSQCGMENVSKESVHYRFIHNYINHC